MRSWRISWSRRRWNWNCIVWGESKRNDSTEGLLMVEWSTMGGKLILRIGGMMEWDIVETADLIEKVMDGK